MDVQKQPARKKHSGLAVAAIALIAATTCLLDIARPVHFTGRWAMEVTPAPTAVQPAPAAPDLPALPQGNPAAAEKPALKKAPPAANPAAATPTEADLPPSVILTPERDPSLPLPDPAAVAPWPAGPPPGRDLAVAPPPADVPLPEAPRPAPLTPAAPPPRVEPRSPAIADSSPAGPADSNGVWRETVTQREQPEVQVSNLSHLRGEIFIQQGDRLIRWDIRPSPWSQREAVTPGEYAYEVRGPIYRMTGRPDVAGTLRCRRFRLYEFRVYQRAPWDFSTQRRDVGD